MLGNGVAVHILQRYGVTGERVQAEIKMACPSRGAWEEVAVHIPYTVAAFEVLAAAHQEAKKVQHTFTGAEHLLLAILQSEATSVSDFFKGVKVDRERMRAVVMEEME
jgi:ATP-dependent Clp protease ATP-binding subunit ClpC